MTVIVHQASWLSDLPQAVQNAVEDLPFEGPEFNNAMDGFFHSLRLPGDIISGHLYTCEKKKTQQIADFQSTRPAEPPRKKPRFTKKGPSSTATSQSVRFSTSLLTHWSWVRNYFLLQILHFTLPLSTLMGIVFPIFYLLGAHRLR